jgi:hypothetical protein
MREMRITRDDRAVVPLMHGQDLLRDLLFPQQKLLKIKEDGEIL